MRCGHCGYEAPTDAVACPACAVPLRAGRPDAPVNPFEAPRAAPPAAAPPVDVGAGTIPWEQERSLPAMLETLRKMLLETGATFDGAQPHAPVGPAMLYLLILGGLGGLAQAAWTAALVAGGDGGSVLEIARFFISSLFSVVVGVVFATFVITGVVHVTLTVLAGGTRGYGATFRVYAYAAGSTALFALLPGVGSVIQTVWSLVIVIQGLHRIHGVSAMRAVLAVVLPAVVLFGLALGVVMVTLGQA